MEKFGLLALNGGGSGGGLPSVTSSDNGKVLGVVSGEWDKMSVPSDALVCTFTKSGNTISCDKTGDEIAAAYEAKKVVIGYADYDWASSSQTWWSGKGVVYLSKMYYTSGSPTTCYFTSVNFRLTDGFTAAESGVFAIVGMKTIGSVWTWTADYVDPADLPPVNSSDNGKVLAVENGAWAAAMKDPLVVTYTITGAAVGGKYPLSADRTFADIIAAYTAGCDVIGRCAIPLSNSTMIISASFNEILINDNSSSPTYNEPIAVMYGVSGVDQVAMTGLVGSVQHLINDTASLAMDYFPLTSQFDYDSTTHTLTLNL